MLLLARVPMARREAAIGATTATIVRPWKNPEFVPRTGRHVAAYVYIYHVRMLGLHKPNHAHHSLPTVWPLAGVAILGVPAHRRAA